MTYQKITNFYISHYFTLVGKNFINIDREENKFFDIRLRTNCFNAYHESPHANKQKNSKSRIEFLPIEFLY